MAAPKTATIIYNLFIARLTELMASASPEHKDGLASLLYNAQRAKAGKTPPTAFLETFYAPGDEDEDALLARWTELGVSPRLQAKFLESTRLYVRLGRMFADIIRVCTV